MGGRAVRIEEADPKGLVRESYAIDGITLEECQSIIIDWALSLPVGLSMMDALRALIAHYALDRPDHPMSSVMNDGLTAPETPRRRGGRAARVQGG